MFYSGKNSGEEIAGRYIGREAIERDTIRYHRIYQKQSYQQYILTRPLVNKPVSQTRMEQDKPRVLTSDGNSKLGAHVRSNLGY